MPRHTRVFALALTCVLQALPLLAQTPTPEPTPEQLTFDEAVRRAIEKNPTVAEAAQSILRAEAFLQQARTIFRPSINADITTTVLDAERGFDDFVTQPRTQSFVGGSVAYPILAAAQWAAKTQAEDQIRVARLSVTETRRQVAIATGQAYLAVIAARRQVDVNLRARENAQAHVTYARQRLDAGAGSKLNELRAAQEVATDEVLLEATRFALRRAQEALGVLVAADAPIDAADEPAFEVVPPPSDQAWLLNRADVQLFSAQIEAADRVFRDSWRDWVPSASVSFEPQWVAPAGLFQPSRTWRGVLSVAIPIFDGGARSATKRLRQVELDTARVQLTDVELRARSELRTAQAAVDSRQRAATQARVAAQHATEVLKITDVAFRAGASTNIELIDAQRESRDADAAAAIAEDLARLARLDLLVALGRFPQ